MVLLMKLEAIEHAKFRAMSQINVDKDKGVEAFEDYMKIAFPYIEAQKGRDKQEHLERLKQEIGRGPVSITAVMQTKMRSKLKTKMVQRKKPQSREEADDLYKKLGDSIPIR